MLTFETTGGTPLAPTVTTLAASAMTNTTATIAGMVNPNGQATAYTFEYGPGTGFGAITTVVALDDASTAEPLSAALTGLTPDTRYAYRVVATNATGTSAGAVMTFDTGPGGTPDRDDRRRHGHHRHRRGADRERRGTRLASARSMRSRPHRGPDPAARDCVSS